MRKLKWSETYAIHVPEIDAEHRAIFRVAGELAAAALPDAAPEQLEPILADVAAHIAGHFAHEERMMQSTGYSGLAWHKKQHHAAAGRALQLIQECRAGTAGAARTLLEYLSDWMHDHIRLSDQMLGAHLRNYERHHSRLAS